MVLYYLIPLYSKIISIEYTENVRINLNRIFEAFKSNKWLLIKFFFYFFQAYLCFNFITNFFPKNQICGSLINDKKYFDKIVLNNSDYIKSNLSIFLI